jgi:Putative auto-transporter adhesin, head GIN domain
MNGHLARIAMVSFGIAAICLVLGALTGGLSFAGQNHRWWRVAALGCAGTPSGASDGRQDSVTLAWEATDRLDIDLPATVDYRPGPKGEAVVSGDAGLISHVRLSGGELGFDSSSDCFPAGSLAVHLTGPAVGNWRLRGSGKLTLSGIDQDALDIEISGSGDVGASGTARRMALRISGSGAADLSKLVTKSAALRLSGSGEADVAPQDEADIHISGSGSVVLHGHPARIKSHVSGSGRIRQEP